jgi:multiphosphoryl transfer protein
MAGDSELTPILIGLELDELSVSPALVPGVKKTILGLNFADCRAAAQEILKEPARDNIRAALRRLKKT